MCHLFMGLRCVHLSKQKAAISC